MTTTSVQPFRQGDLDNLCGLYAIVNGVRLALAPCGGLSKIQSRTLFKRGASYLEDIECGDIVHRGLDSKSWHGLARFMFDHLYEKQIADLKCGKSAFRKLHGSRDAAIDQIERAVERGIPVAIELRNALNHYSVVAASDEDHWFLFDSRGFRSVKKKSLGLAGSEIRHILGPRAIFFIPRF